MVATIRRNGRWSLCLCCLVLALASLSLGSYKLFGQIPPPGGGGAGTPTIQFSASNYTVAEGDIATITVTLSATYTQTVSVNYATSNGTGTSGVDYTATSGTLYFSPGTTSQNFNVATLVDSSNTTDVTAYLTLSSPNNGTLGTSSATLYIVNPSACQ